MKAGGATASGGGGIVTVGCITIPDLVNLGHSDDEGVQIYVIQPNGGVGGDGRTDQSDGEWSGGERKRPLVKVKSTSKATDSNVSVV